ncbi:unnamed protein product [Caenorhabditis brenneri]
MSSTSMSLKSLHFLLQHMEANKRFEISQRCTALREFEKSVPLKINRLVLSESYVIVNDTTYKLGIIRKCKVGEAPNHVAATNEWGGDPCEVDTYGIRDKADRLKATPGDVVTNQRRDQILHDEELETEELEEMIQYGVIRLPVGLKLQIEQLIFRGDTGTSVNVLAPILHESSYPLKKLKIDVLLIEDATSPIVNTAGILGIRVIFRNPLQTISAITNPVVHFTLTRLFRQTTRFEELVEHWIQSKRPLGHEYIFHYNYEPILADEIEDILERLNGKPVDDENVVIPMSEVTQLKVSYGPFPEFAPRTKWAFKFLTELIEH